MLVINLNQDSFWIDFLSPILGVIISATIAWIVYRQKEVEKQVKTNLENFFYIFYAIIKNFEEFHNTKYQISEPALIEIYNAINSLNEVKKLFDWYTDNGPPTVSLQLPNEEAKKEYIFSQAKKHHQSLSLSVSTQTNFTYVDKKNFEKESIFITNFGDVNFQAVINRLDTIYNIVDDVQKTILKYNEENIELPRSRYRSCTISFKFENNEYISEIAKHQGYLLYKETVYKTLDDTLNRGLLYSYNALCHLEAFFHHYSKKYRAIFHSMGINSKEFRAEDNLIEGDDFFLLMNNLNEEECRLWSIPLYANIKRNFWDELNELFFYTTFFFKKVTTFKMKPLQK